MNSSPRTPALPFVPVQHPSIGDPRPTTRDEYPLLTVAEQRQSRQSPAPSSLFVERSLGGDSGRQSIGLPRDVKVDRRSGLLHPRPLTPKRNMPMAHLAPSNNADGNHQAPITIPRPDDPEAAGARVLRTLAPDRISLPSRPGSIRSHRTGTAHGDEAGADNDDANSEYAWGPKHPCYPHTNPHVPVDSPLYHSTRIIRISRDWMQAGDLAPTFQNLYPEVLDPLISEDEFRSLIKHINDELVNAFDPLTWRAWVDAAMGVATLWLWEDLGCTKVKAKLRGVEKWIERWNREYGEREGVRIIPLRRTGYLSVRASPMTHYILRLRRKY